MKGKWQRPALAAVLAILAVAGLTSWMATREPSYHGQPLSFWLTQFRSGRTRRDAEDAIRQMGTNVVPVLFDHLRQQEEDDSSSSGFSQNRFRSRWSNPYVPGLASRALNALGPPILPQLITACGDPSVGVREAAVQAISLLGPDAASAIPALLHLLQDPHGQLRVEAVSALSRMERFRAEAVPGLTSALETGSEPQFERNTPWRAAVIRLLGAIGPEAAAAAPQLKKIWDAENADPLLRDEAAGALWHIQTNPQVVPWFKARLAETTQFDQSARAFRALGDIGPPAKDAVPLIMQKAQGYATSHDPFAPNLAQMAAVALQKIDPASAQTLREDQFQVLDLKSLDLTNAPAKPSGRGARSGPPAGRGWGPRSRVRGPAPQP